MQGTLFDTFTPMINKAIERVIDAHKFSQSLGLGKLWVCFSGGKDSVCLYGVVKKAAEKMNIPLLDFAELHYNVTGIDPPELVQFIKEEFPFVHRDLYKESMWQLIERKQMPPTRLVRYCCAELKEKGGEGRFCATGVRWAESTQRKSRGEFEDIGKTKAEGKILFNDNDDDRRQMEHCIPKRKYVVNPIIDFTDEDVWQFIREENLPYCKLYDQGYERLGCIGCPMAGGKRQQEELDKYPKFRDAYIRAFDRMLIKRKESGLETKWQTGQDVFDWWVGNDKTESPIEGQGGIVLTYQQMQTAKSKTIDSILMSIESEIKKTYRFGRDNITGLVKDAYAKHLVGVDSADYYKTLNLYNRLKDMEQEIKGVYIQIGRQTRKAVTKGMYTTFDESYLMDRYTTAFFSDSIGSNIKYSAPNPIVREVAVTGDATRLTAIRDTRLRRIAEGMIPPSGDTLTGILVNNLNNELTKTLRVVKQGLINGQSYVKQAQALKDTFNGNAYNALRVVRTEGNRLANAGTYLNSEDLKESGVKIRRQWVATLDGRTRDSHQALDGQFEDEDGLFHIHGLSARYPGDFGDPAEDIQCRCTTIDVVQGLEPTLRRGVNPVTGKSDIASYRDYDKWKKQGLK